MPQNPVEPAETEGETPFVPKPEDIKKAFRVFLDFARGEDTHVRDEYMRLWTKLEYYWNNILDIFWDGVARDWRVPDWDRIEGDEEFPPRLINIFRPHGEAIVAALSVTIPAVVFHPGDADNPDDIEAAQAHRRIIELLQLQNSAGMQLIKCIVTLFNQGTVFGYNYHHTDPKFGYFKKPRIENKEIAYKEARCPECGSGLDAAINLEESYSCEECGYEGEPEIEEKSEVLPQITGFDKKPKDSICQEIFSGTQVKVSAYARKQEECGYLLLEFPQSADMLRNIFEDKEDLKIEPTRHDLTFDTFSKFPLQYMGQMPDNAVNVSCLWLRPWQFWHLGQSDENRALVKHLKSTYPNGCYAIFLDDEFVEAYDEDMDDHWTVSENPMGKFIYARPLGENLATVQDIRADLVELELQTVEHGIPETFADPNTLDFKKYGQQRARPGMVTQAKAKPGKTLGDSFHTTKTAILSQEVDPLRQHIDQDAQFVVGSFPSVYGGPAMGGSKTAAEYSQSRNMALQRLGTINKILNAFWAKFQEKSSREYAQVLRDRGEDEKFTKKVGDNSYINVWIRATSLSGDVGRAEPETSDSLPLSWAQKKDVILQLLQSGIPEIQAVLTHPRNASIMKEATGLQELYVPGDEARNRQIKEFSLLAQGIPVPTNFGIDNDQVHIEVLRTLLEGPHGDSISEEGRNACMMHLQEHQMNMSGMQGQGMGGEEPLPTMGSEEEAMAEGV